MLLEDLDHQRMVRHWQQKSDFRYFVGSFSMWLGCVFIDWAFRLTAHNGSTRSLELFSSLFESMGNDDAIVAKHCNRFDMKWDKAP